MTFDPKKPQLYGISQAMLRRIVDVAEEAGHSFEATPDGNHCVACGAHIYEGWVPSPPPLLSTEWGIEGYDGPITCPGARS